MKPGVYPEQVTLRSGGSVAPFQLQALPGGVVLDGADLLSDPAKWVQFSGNVWLASSVNWSPGQVFADGTRLAASSAAPASLPARSFRWVSGTGLCVNAGGGSPAGHLARVGHRAYGLRAISRAWVTIDGFTVTRTEDSGIYLWGACKNVTVTHNTVSFANRMGIQVVGGSQLLLGSNTVSDNNDHGIALIDGSPGSVLEDNESFRNARPAQGSANGIHVSNNPGTILRRNRLHDNQDSGLHIQSGSNNCVSYLNTSWNNGDHGYDHIGATGTFHACDVAYGNRVCGFMFQSSSTETHIYDCIATNNGLATNSYDLRVSIGSVPGLVSDYNLFWNSTSQPPVRYGNTIYSSVATYATETGQDTLTLQADPRFVNPAAGDFHLLAGSPAIDNAISVVGPWPALDAAGRPRADDPAAANAGAGPVTYADRGALEFIPADQAPLVFSPFVISIPEGSPLTFTVHAADADGQPITSLAADLSRLPAVGNAAFAAQPGDTSGTLSWTPGYADSGTYTVGFTALNNFSGSATTTISVINVDRAPVVTVPATTTVAEAATLTLVVHAADPDDQPLGSLTANLPALPPGAAFTAAPGDTTGTLTWTPGYGDSGTYTVTFTAANALSGAASTVITVTNVDRAPVVTAPATATVAEGATITLLVHAADPDGQPLGSLTANLPALPPGAAFTAGPGDTTGTLTWTPTHHDAGSYSITFTAANGLSDSATTTVTVTDVNLAPAVTAPPAVAATETSPLTLTVQAADADGEAIASLTANLSSLPAGNNALFTPGPENTAGTLSWTPTYNDAGSYTVTFTAANGLSGSASTVFSVANLDRAPVVTAPAAASVLEAGALTVTVQAADPDGEAITSLSANLSGLPAGHDAIFTPSPGNTSGTLTWTPTYADSGHHTVTFTAANALSGSASTAITVTDVYHPYEAGTFYVDVSNPACSDDGPGTEEQPYCSISAALANHEGPGTALIVKPGVYRERVEFGASGSPDSSIILHASGSGVVIDGADDFSNPGLWAPYSGNVWLAASADWDPKQVFADSVRLAPSASSPDALAPGTFVWVTGAGLYVNVGGGNPASHQILVGRRKNGFIAYAEEWLTIEGFTVTHMEDRSIFMDDNCLNVKILHNTVTFGYRYGIQVSGGYGFTIGSNITSDNSDHGISLVNGVTGSVIEDNESFRNARPIQRAANGIYVNACTGNTIRRNRLHDNQDTGLHFGSGADDNVCYLNRSWNNGDHGFDHVGSSGTIHICDVAYGNYKDGFSIEGASQRTQIYNSIAVENGLGTNEFDLWIDLSSTPGFASDYNLFWNSTGQPPIKYISTLYPSVAAYSAASGRDAQTLQLDPGFVNAAAGDFHLNAGSPAIDNANSAVSNWPAADAEDHARIDDPMRTNAGAGPVPYADRGPFEYRPAVLAIAPTSGTAPLVVSASAAGSIGPDGTAVSYRFDFGDGTVVGPQPGTTAAHTYSAGNWTATVTVTGQGGGTCAAAATVAVNARPTAALTASPATGDAPLDVTLNAAASSDPDGTIVSYRFDFGDGAVAGPQASPTASHTYAPGTWAPCVTVTDNGGGTALATTLVTSLNAERNPPVITAAPFVSVAEAGTLAMTIHAADPDSEPIAALTADLTGLPAGNNAAFTPGPGDSTGLFTWTPTYNDSGSYTVRFVATNDQAGSANTVITVTNLDRAPSPTAPATANGVVASTLTVHVTAADPDGDPITALTANLSGLPAGNNAVFVADAGDTAGTLTWTPAAGDSGTHSVTFTAANALSASASTSITVKATNRPPTATLVVSPSTGNEPLAVVANASGSSDADGTIVSYRFDFGDGIVVGPQSGATTSHAYAAGEFTASVVVTDENGAAGTATAHVIVAAVGSGPNLVANPSFESNISGWGPYNGAAVQRVAGGFDGAWSMKMSGPANSNRFGGTDSPNWVDTTPAAGTRYRFTAWVRAASAHGQARLRIREYLDGNRIGSSGYFSNEVWLSPTWQLLLIDYVAQRTGSTLDLQIEDTPAAAGEEFQVDDVSIRIVPAAPPAMAEFRRMTPLGSVEAVDAVLDLDAADPFWGVRIRVASGPDGSIPRLSRLALRYQDREVAASETACSTEGACTPLEVWFDRQELKTLFAGLRRGGDGVTATVIAEPFGGATQVGTLAVQVRGAPEPLRPVVSPNPMRAQGAIGFATSRSGPIQAELFDASGRRVRRLAAAAAYESGWHEVAVDGRDDGGSMLATGIYFYRIVSVDGVVTGRLVLLR